MPPADGLSPFIPTLLGDLEAAVRDALGLKPDVRVTCDISSRRDPHTVPFTLNLPNGIALPMGLVDVKVCEVDAVWSGLKLVIRKELRQEQSAKLAAVK